jgi:hypothetical protein
LRTDVAGSIELATDGVGLRARIFGDTFDDRLGAALW